MEHNPYTYPVEPSSLPNVLPRYIVEAALPLEIPEPYEAGLLVSVCPGVHPEGKPRTPHRLRLKLLDAETVDVFCPDGCGPRMLAAAICDLYTASLEQVA